MAAAEPGVAHAAHRRLDAAVRGGVRLVDVDRAGPQPGGDGQAAAAVLGPDAGVEPVRRSVGAPHGLVLVGEAVEGDDGPEGLLRAHGHGGLDAVEDRRLVEEGAYVGAGPAARDEPGALGDGLLDVPADGLQLPLADQRSHVRAVGEGRAEPHRLGAGGEALQERVGYGVVHVQPLYGDAQLSGGGEAAADGARGGLVEVGVVEDQHGVLAAEFEGGADEAGGGALGDLAARTGGAGEGDVVGVGDDGGADDGALAENDLPDGRGQPGLDEEVAGPQGGEGRLGVGLHDDGVARDEGGEGVADGEFERVVPRGDLPYDAARPAQFGDLGQRGDDPGVRLGPQVGVGAAAVVAGGDGDALHLLVRVQPRLAGLQLDEVQDLGLAAQHEVVEAQEDSGAPLYGRGGPAPLRLAGPVEGVGDVVRGGLGQVGEFLAGERGVVGGGAAADDAAGQAGDEVGGDHVGGGARAGGGDGVAAGRGGTVLWAALRVRHAASV